MLCLAPALEVYGPDARALRERLEQQDNAAELETLEQPEQVFLSEQGQTPWGWRFTSLAFRQICQRLAPGLAQVILDLAGEGRRGVDDGPECHSLPAALELYAQVVRRRFRARLEGWQLVLDRQTGVVDGLVGRAYQRLSNALAWELLESALPAGLAMTGALVTGRRLEVYLLRPVRVLLPGGVDEFQGGAYLCNSEVGDCSAALHPLLLRWPEELALLGPATGRAAHAGRGVSRRFARLAERLQELTQEVPQQLPRQVTSWRGCAFGFTGEGEAEDEAAFASCAQRLMERGLTRAAAWRVVREAYLGHPECCPTGYDVLLSLLRAAKAAGPSQRRAWQRLGYDWLFSRRNHEQVSD